MSYSPKFELNERLNRFINTVNNNHPEWEVCVITGGVNLYYFTGTMCDGLFLIHRDKGTTLWVRRSYERALIESGVDDIRPMRSFRDIADSYSKLPDTVYSDKANISLEWYELFNKHMQFNDVVSVDRDILNVRAVKSEYELDIMKQAGSETDRIYREDLPGMLRPGISEAELGADLFALFIKRGFHAVSRFAMRNVDSVLGHVSFGDSTMYPSAFNGASGIKGLSPAAPVLGNHDRFLQEGDLIYVDLGIGTDGYHIDKTTVFSYAKPQPDHVIKAHNHCLDLEHKAVSMLKPGAIPAEIYEHIIASVDPEYKTSFMGTEGRTVPFIGHGVGLNVDEMPVLAKGFTKPLENNMSIAVEPKIGLPGFGMVGSENTYIVTPSGGVSLTGVPGNLNVI